MILRFRSPDVQDSPDRASSHFIILHTSGERVFPFSFQGRTRNETRDRPEARAALVIPAGDREPSRGRFFRKNFVVSLV